MAMQTGAGADDDIVASINTTPLVDVMLVLLIIFLITIPVATQAIAVKLPTQSVVPRESRPDTVSVGVDARGALFWNTLPLPDDAALLARLAETARRDPQPEVQVRGDQDARYESVARVVHASQLAGIRKLGFITEPAR